MLPEARVTHALPSRVRIRVPAQRGDEAWFARAAARLRALGHSVEPNATTASLLLTGRAIDVAAVGAAAEADGLFHLVAASASEGQRILLDVTNPVRALDERVRRATGGQVDLPLAVFLYLMGAAAYQVVRGNIAAPPWYSGLWYAFGVYSRKLADRLPPEPPPPAP